MALRLWLSGYVRFGLLTFVAVVLSASFLSPISSSAAVTYSVFDSIYEQNFDFLTATPQNSLPKSPENASLGSSPSGWINDTASPAAGNFSIPGWYLYHPTNQTEGGFNGNQRMRVGAGSSTTGAFWSFGASGADDRALGSLGSATTGPGGSLNYIGLRLINGTGSTINSFSVAYDGEQWRGSGDGGETLSFAYNLGATDNGDDIPEAWEWFDPGTEFISVPALSFTAPIGAATAAPVDGNNLGRVERNGTINGVEWLPGQELWLRWSDINGAAATQDGLAIDNFRFSTAALPGGGGVPEILSAMSGNASAPSTWQNNAPPVAGNIYRVLDTHTVTVDYTDTLGGSPFPGTGMRVNDGGTLQFSTSGVYVPLIILEDGANIVETVSGDFALGDIFAPNLGSLQTNADLSFNIDTNSAFFLDMVVQGPGDLTFNAASGSELWLTAAGGHGGVIKFDGTGKRVMITEQQTFGTLEMNSTAENILYYNPTAQADSGTVIFNQPGTIDHAATSVTPQRRLHGVNFLEANAEVTVDLTKRFPDDVSTPVEERRYQVATGMRGAANVTAIGTATNSSNGTNISLNEFEVGATSEPTNLATSTYSGVFTATQWVNAEFRQNFIDGKFVAQNNGRIEFGHQAVAPVHSLKVGEIEIESGGIVEVGFEQQYGTAGTALHDNAGHHIYKLTMTNEGSRTGDLTINDGGTLRMQVNGTGANQFDQIETFGDVTLDGTLNVLINPSATVGSNGKPNGTTQPDNPFWSSISVGQTIDIIVLSSTGSALIGDYNNDLVVDGADYVMWQKINPTGTAEYDDWVHHFGETGGGSSIGEITGQFDNVVVTDYNGAFGGFAFQVNYLADRVQLQVVAAGSGGSDLAVPEPSTMILLALVLPFLPSARRRVFA
jgi:hypothetical protein